MADDDEGISTRLTALLVQLGSALLTDRELGGDLDRITRLTTRLLPQSSGASVTMLVSGEPTTMATTDRVTFEVDLVQYDVDEGPCLTALGGQAVRIGFLEHDEQFPHFAVRTADTRVRSVISTPAFDHGVLVGSLNAYSNEVDAFDDSDGDVCEILSSEVANAIFKSVTMRRAARLRDELQEHYDERTVVARAAGVLMAIEDCSAAQATRLIHRAASEHGERLIATAERILANVLTSEPAPDTSDSGRRRSD